MDGATKSCASATALAVLVCLALAVHGDGAHAGAPAPAVDCSSALLGLSDCLTFVEAGSAEAKPQKQCCSGLKKVVKKEVGCLCDAFKQGASFGVKLNMTKALSLPSACGVSTPPLTKCKIAVAGVPAAAPAPSPFSGAPSGMAIVPSPSSGHISEAAVSTAPVGGLISVAIALCVYYYI